MSSKNQNSKPEAIETPVVNTNDFQTNTKLVRIQMHEDQTSDNTSKSQEDELQIHEDQISENKSVENKEFTDEQLSKLFSFQFVICYVLNPKNLGKIVWRCFNTIDVIMLQILAIIFALVVVFSGFDWWWLDQFRPLSLFGQTCAGIVLPLGTIQPPIFFLYLWCRSRSKKDLKTLKLAIKILQGALIQVIYVTLIKAITGREHAPPMDENLGYPCVRNSWDENEQCRGLDLSTRKTNNWPHPMADQSVLWFYNQCGYFLCDPKLAITGWPSGHTMSVTTLVVTLLLTDKSLGKMQKIFWIVYASLVSYIMAISVHWLSDVLSGFCCGLVVAFSVNRTKITF